MNPLHSKIRPQLGGTLTGLIVGVLIGLGAALAVAVYVTNVPVPFVDRGVTRKPAQDAAEAEHNKGWNPNAGLTTTPAPLPAPNTEGVTSAGPTLLEPGAEAVANDPLGDLLRLKEDPPGRPAPIVPAPLTTPAPAAPVGTAAPAPSATAQSQPFVYFVQVGAFRSAEDADAQRARVALMGMAASVTEREQNGRQVYRVRLGPFSQRPMAEATRDQLTVAGVDATLVRVER